jgi:hypothetical protein
MLFRGRFYIVGPAKIYWASLSTPWTIVEGGSRVICVQCADEIWTLQNGLRLRSTFVEDQCSPNGPFYSHMCET